MIFSSRFFLEELIHFLPTTSCFQRLIYIKDINSRLFNGELQDLSIISFQMSRFTPPCSAYITSVGTWSLEQGLFIKASKEEDAVAANKTARKTSLPDKTTTIKVNDCEYSFPMIKN